MRRIDLACKLLSPLLIASIDSVSTSVAIWTTLAMTCVSVPAEYLFIKQVKFLYPRFTLLFSLDHLTSGVNTKVYNLIPSLQHRKQREGQLSLLRSILGRTMSFSSVGIYARSPAFLPSLSYAFLHLTVLSFSGRMIAFLLAAGYTPLHVGLARLVSTVAELSATWISPRLTARVGYVRAGGWSVAWQTVWLTLGVALFLAVRGGGVTGLVIGVILSRIGLWGFELAVANIIQDVSFFPFPIHRVCMFVRACVFARACSCV